MPIPVAMVLPGENSVAAKKLPSVMLRAGEDRRVRSGHPWAFSNEILMDAETKALPPGSLVILRTPGGEALGVAVANDARGGGAATGGAAGGVRRPRGRAGFRPACSGGTGNQPGRRQPLRSQQRLGRDQRRP